MKAFISTIFFFLLFLSPVAVADQSTSTGTTREFFDWYHTVGTDYQAKILEAKPYFTDDFFNLLTTSFSQTPEALLWMDFDPFTTAEVQAIQFPMSAPKSIGDGLESLEVTPTYYTKPGDVFATEAPMMMECKEVDGVWKIANIIYVGDKPLNLRDYLQKQIEKSSK